MKLRLLRLALIGAVIVISFAAVAGLWLHFDRRPAFKMLVEVVGSGGSASETHADFQAQYRLTSALIRRSGVPIVEARPHAVQPDETGDSFIEKESLLLRDSDEKRLTRLYLELRQADAQAEVPSFAFLPQDSVLFLLFITGVLSLSILEVQRREDDGDPTTVKTPALLISFFVSGLLTASAMLVHAKELWLYSAPFVPLLLALPAWSVISLGRALRAASGTGPALALTALVVGSPIFAWFARYVSL